MSEVVKLLLMSDRVLRSGNRVDYAVLDDGNTAVAVALNENSSGETETSVESSSTSVVADHADQVDTKMATDLRLNQLAAELETIFFQMGEIDEIVNEELATMSLQDAKEQYDELKELRIAMVKVNTELKLLHENNDYAIRVDDICHASKETLKKLKSQISAIERNVERSALDQTILLRVAEEQKNRTRQLAFSRASNEIKSMYVTLNASYAAPATALDRASMLKRKEDQPVLAAEFDRFRERVDKLIQTDVVMDTREQELDYAQQLLAQLEKSKKLYESKVYTDLVANDLTEDKLKLAEMTQINVGKFSGATGEDFYSFKTRFLKAYGNHPKSLMVEWLKNNHLDGKAKESVGSLEDMDNIWKRLKDNFGNTEGLLLYHFGRINKLGPMRNRKSYTSKKHYVQVLINTMQDVIDLATEHELLGEIHYGPQLGKVVGLLENHMQNQWFKIITEESVIKPNRWMRMIIYLEAQLSIIQTRAFETESAELQLLQDQKDQKGDPASNDKPQEKGKKPPFVGFTPSDKDGKKQCSLCEDKHPNPGKDFFQCKKFLEMSRNDRKKLVMRLKKCLQCLGTGTRWNDSNHTCSDKWVCLHDSHDSFKKKLHFLLCEEHMEFDKNIERLVEFKNEVLKADWQQNLIHSGFISRVDSTVMITKKNEPGMLPTNELPDAADYGEPVFLLQPISFNDYVFNLMYDSGCKKFVSRKAAVDNLPEDCKDNVIKGPMFLKGVGDSCITSKYGHYSVKLPIFDGRMARFSGLCLDIITGAFPPYPVREARKTIVDAYAADGGSVGDLPQVPVLVGGETDFLIGSQYNWYQPRLMFILPTGLAIYKSMFIGVDGSRGCIGGSHEVFTQCERQFLETHTVTEFRVFLAEQIKLFNNGYAVCLDCDSLSVNNSLHPHGLAVVDENDDSHNPRVMLLSDGALNEADAAGSIIEYRCVGCRGCNNCKKGEQIEKASMESEFQQHVIDNCVSVDFENEETTALLPFIAEPTEKLASSNEEIADEVYAQQVKKLSKLPSVKEEVLASEKKLQDAGHVEWVKNLSPEDAAILESHLVKYYMPWRFVHNENSATTPTRIVFDASSITKSGYSLNDILAKGINSMNSLLSIFLRFRCNIVAVHTDIRKMYNVIKLKPQHWTYQRYKWQENLDPDLPNETKFVRTLIYGVKSAGNQAQVGLRMTAERQKDEYPEAADAIIKDTYVDDCATGVMETPAEPAADKLAADIEVMVGKTGFVTKGITRSGNPPLPDLSKDGVSVSVLGSKWLPELDVIQIAAGPLNFAKKQRGRSEVTEDAFRIPDQLTKRICSSKSAEPFDVSGLVAPILGGLKCDIRDLIEAGYDWDDVISDAFRQVWLQNFDLIVKIGDLVYRRAVVPDDALNMDIELIGAGDATKKLACAGCYIRYQLKNGGHSCQLILGKTKIVTDKTLPRAELIAATMNVHVMEIAKKSLKNKCIGYMLVSDSEIALFWLTSQTKRQKPWVRNRAIEVNRFSKPEDWVHTESEKNPADIGTRKGATIEDVSEESEWIRGKPWMSLPFSEIRKSHVRSIDEIRLKQEQVDEINKELMGPATDLCCSDFHLLLDESNNCAAVDCFLAGGSEYNHVGESDISAKVKERLLFSNYLINPNRFKFSKVVRVMALVIKAATHWLNLLGKKLEQSSHPVDPLSDGIAVNRSSFEKIECVNVAKSVDYVTDNGVLVVLTDGEIQHSLDYFFQKASEEVKEFLPPKAYENISFERNNILYYSGRVLAENITFHCPMTDIMLDLSSGSFIVPLVERHSPLAYSIVDQVHWYHATAKHSGVETTIRYIMNIAHIFGVRNLVKVFRKQCIRCRYLLKRTLDVEMAPASKHQLCVAPPYYIAQLDLTGPYDAYSKHNKRTTIKIWILVAVCSTTGMTNLKVMEGYDATQFIQAFSRFSCEAGFPKFVLIDSGSQLVSGCQNMKLNMCDIKGVLNREYGIEFDTCPVAGHNYHGKVERKIKAIQESIEKTAHSEKLSSLQWETLCSEISNSINNLPIAIGNETECLESLDLITPNRLRLGRNNDRSPVGTLDITDKVDRILRLNSDIFETWWETWLVSVVPKIMPKPKWFRTNEHLKVGDVILFAKDESSLTSGSYRYGMVESIRRSEDGRIRSITVRYRNSAEAIDRTTIRAVRSLIVIHRIDELNIAEELGKATLIPNSATPSTSN